MCWQCLLLCLLMCVLWFMTMTTRPHNVMTSSFLSVWSPEGLEGSQQRLLAAIHIEIFTENKCLCPLLVSVHSQHVCCVCWEHVLHYCKLENLKLKRFTRKAFLGAFVQIPARNFNVYSSTPSSGFGILTQHTSG